MAVTINGTTGIETNADTGKVKVGADDDLQIHHNGTASFISNDTGDLRIQNNDANWIYIEAKPNENSIVCKDDGAVELYHDSTKQCETSANGLAFPSGKGIDFSATSDGTTKTSELLDDYEEGTFTPAWKGASNHGTTSYGDTNTACYTKIGNIVHVQGYSKVTGNSGGSGAWIMDNLPFPAWNNSAQSVGTIMMYNANLPAGAGWATVYANQDTSNLYIYNSEDDGVWQQFTISNDSAWWGFFQITYTTSA